MNCDYKIAAKAIANRLKRVLPRLIDHDQTGFLKGRFIGENIRLFNATIKYTAAKNIPGLLLFLDFEMAFDTVEWSFIQKTFRHFNFGPTIINWIKVPINPKFLFRLNKSFYNSEQNGANNFVFGQNRNFL